MVWFAICEMTQCQQKYPSTIPWRLVTIEGVSIFHPRCSPRGDDAELRRYWDRSRCCCRKSRPRRVNCWQTWNWHTCSYVVEVDCSFWLLEILKYLLLWMLLALLLLLFFFFFFLLFLFFLCRCRCCRCCCWLCGCILNDMDSSVNVGCLYF